MPSQNYITNGVMKAGEGSTGEQLMDKQTTLDFRGFQNQFESSASNIQGQAQDGGTRPQRISFTDSFRSTNRSTENQGGRLKIATFSAFPLLSNPSTNSQGVTSLLDPAYHSYMSPPPLLYGTNKYQLIEFAKLFGTLHRYKLVIVKNDDKRCILKCSRHIGKTNPLGRSTHYDQSGTTIARNLGTDDELGTYPSCDFRVDIQLKKRKKLWLLKPLITEHNHEDVIQLPHIHAIQEKSRTMSRVTKEDIPIRYFCQATNHSNCSFIDNLDLLGQLFDLPVHDILSEYVIDDVKLLKDSTGDRKLNEMIRSTGVLRNDRTTILPTKMSGHTVIPHQGTTSQDSSSIDALSEALKIHAKQQQQQQVPRQKQQPHHTPETFNDLKIPDMAHHSLESGLNYEDLITPALKKQKTPNPIQDPHTIDVTDVHVDANEHNPTSVSVPTAAASLGTTPTLVSSMDPALDQSLRYKLSIKYSITNITVILELQDFIMIKRADILQHVGLEFSFIPMTRTQLTSQVFPRPEDVSTTLDSDFFIIEIFDVTNDKLLKYNVVKAYSYTEILTVIKDFTNFLRSLLNRKYGLDLPEE